MMLLDKILKDVQIISIVGEIAPIEISSVVFDSRKASKDSLFVAQKGTHVNGHQYIDKVIEQGASVIVCEEIPSRTNTNVIYIQVENSNTALAVIASNFYNNPSSQLKLVGVTGTNGKTTIASLLCQLFTKMGYKTGLLSTVKIIVNNQISPASHTTPDSVAINYYLSEMVKEGVDYCFMEVSSHGIHQGRTYGLDFDGGIFTNLSHDHLDYHKTFAEYRDVKKSFFDSLSKKAFALTNLDDKNGKIMLQNTKAIVKTYAQKVIADYKIKVIEKSFDGMLLQINQKEVWTKLVGGFNASNIGAIFGAAQMLGIQEDTLLLGISQLESVDGRFEYTIASNGVVSIVDYAHTPDALQNILETIQEIANTNNKIITVVGCGGDRDKTKRPVMAKIAATYSNQVFLTSDNPRTEDPEIIIQEMESGIPKDLIQNTLSITDRKQAIKAACKFAKAGDVILVAGKGHETYQEINGIRTHFDDREILLQTLENHTL